MVNKIVFLIVVFMLISCNSLELIKLSESSDIKIPKDKNFFKKYDNELNIQLPNKIDITSIYEYVYDIDYKNRKFYDSRIGNKSAFKFYEKGKINLFYYDEKNKINFDSNKYGYRGICYKYQNNFRLMLITPVTERKKYGVQNYNMKVKGDTLFVSLNKKHLTKEQIFTGVYVKRKLYNSIKKVDW